MEDKYLNSALRYVGGKSRLYKDIVDIIPEHKCYVEPFGGALWVLFNKNKSNIECVNDISSELMNFWKVIKENFEGFKEKCEYLIPSRELFNDYLKQDIKKLNDLDRAVRYFYINRTCFGGNMVDSPNFGSSNVRRSNLCIATDNLDDFIQPIHNRLKDVYIENMDFRKIIKKFDSKTKEGSDTLFYLDPPYVNMRGYETKFTEQDHIDLFKLLHNMNSKFILSINNDKLILELYKDYNMIHKNIKCKIAQKAEDVIDQKELIITNF